MKTLNQDINYQPETPKFSYSSGPQERKMIKEKMSTFFTHGLGILIILLLFFVLIFAALGILNFLNILHLSNISPIFNNLPKNNLTQEQFIKKLTPKTEEKPYKVPGTNEFTLEGTLKSYDQNSIDIKYGNKTLSAEYDFDSSFFIHKVRINESSNATISATIISIPVFPSSALKQENINKKTLIQYRKEDNKTILESLIIYN